MPLTPAVPKAPKAQNLETFPKRGVVTLVILPDTAVTIKINPSLVSGSLY